MNEFVIYIVALVQVSRFHLLVAVEEMDIRATQRDRCVLIR